MKIFSLFLLLLVAGLSSSFNTDNDISQFYFIQFKINTISTPEEGAKINNFMNKQSGIIGSRADYYTSTYFCYIDINSKLTKVEFENWFKELDLNISCFNKGIETVDKSLSLVELQNCK